ncbi:putative transposase [Escherichia coli P0305260.11]|nr:putative transposase [Escherichia coli P0305260.1]ENA03307.1 putative transposase [Escherichia coli P0299438.2]ENC32448.1 putative transposase [Escherichia coli P0299438.9]ENE06291.1 putative transposase [Escherichia coli P0305260.2]ENF66368.1 putative transposase [Escherichia coli P0305260.10]ENF81819.1 putative transposase [Escherichia coli P0305260.11]ENF90218.1 putative transposase [Escherichia coli P0305260.13]ENF91632.1 putative transposase [Escherichia coli P0305260.15]ENG02826.1 
MALICELDEQWSFVGSKAQQHWLWYAYNTKTGSVLVSTPRCLTVICHFHAR